jgi:hypothetical protein
MKVAFSREVVYVPEWNGNRDLPPNEQFSCTLTPLEMNDLFVVVDALSEVGAKAGTEDNLGALENIAGIKTLVQNVGHILPKYVKVEGIEDDTGPITIDEILKYPVYMNLMGELIAQLSNISMPNEEEVGN